MEHNVNVALVVGVSGITGSHLAKELISEKWTTYGLARNPNIELDTLIPVTADLLDKNQLSHALKEASPTHVFITTWMKKESEEDNIKVNGTMVRNLLEILSPKKSVQHVSLVTGLKHYLGPFDEFVKPGTAFETPLREERPRLALPNFYYAQEDEVFAAAARDGFYWNVHRPHTVIGHTVGNLMNMGTTLAVYASICKYTNTPFRWPGSEAQWNGLSDVVDARLLAKQLIWAVKTPEAHNEAFNTANGDVFRWSWLWKQLAAWFEIEYEGYTGLVKPLENEMADKQEIWSKIANEYRLVESNLSKLASAWHTDLDLGRPIEVMTDMTNSRKLGFTEFQSTKESFYDLFEQLREKRIIP
ncbi:SDR family oxidoreductase [Olivibacter domesticus]|uniref:Nucleoside-diphosphate-sugar epimerase n=1 Tax=Olivibacter domesticus TaxID=407022 RepID=A0A1H7K504_OLID1|nr:SDR family oxidoreductase [Olivibacter domesticus]SEK81540.1 Nucleoside-diphosphate-sugar epimerase [Olivibacter domesticus]